jgi:uncharacterized protein (TIGR02001 family)
MKKLFVTVALALVAGTAQAQLTSNVGMTSDYRFRGVSQTQNAMALQGGVDFATKSGFYVGNWNSTVSNQLYNDSTGLEMDLYGGFKAELFKGVTLDVGSYNYIYSQSGNQFRSNANTNEVYVAVSQGPLTVKYNHSIGEYFGIARSKNTKYIQADLVVPVAPKFTVDAHIGRTLVANNDTLNYTDLRLGGTLEVKSFAVGVHYHTNTAEGTGFRAANTVGGQQLFKDQVVVSVSRKF